MKDDDPDSDFYILKLISVNLNKSNESYDERYDERY